MNGIETLIAISNVLIALLLAYVAWQNYKINEAGYKVTKDKLRLDLFERRYKIFEAFRTFSLSFIGSGKVDRKKFFEFTLNTSDSEFLFNKDITEYRDKVIDKSVRLMQIDLKLGSENPRVSEDTKKNLADEAEVLENWFADQSEYIGGIFRKYLHFSINKDPY